MSKLNIFNSRKGLFCVLYIYKSNFANPFSSYKLLAQHICRGGWLKILQAPMSLLILYFFHITNTRGPNKIHTFVLHLVRERTSVCMCAVHQHQRDPINYNSGFQKNWPVSKDRGRLSRARPTQIAAISYVLGKNIIVWGGARDNVDLFIFIFPEAERA
jgi:hypothetical protein